MWLTSSPRITISERTNVPCPTQCTHDVRRGGYTFTIAKTAISNTCCTILLLKPTLVWNWLWLQRGWWLVGFFCKCKEQHTDKLTYVCLFYILVTYCTCLHTGTITVLSRPAKSPKSTNNSDTIKGSDSDSKGNMAPYMPVRMHVVIKYNSW